jgi:methionyl-tRNA formyltransferase
MRPMRLLMMGTGPFGLPTLEVLLAADHDVVGLVSRPPRGAPRRSAAAESPMVTLARARGIQVWQPASVNSDEAHQELGPLDLDLLVVCDFGQLLAPSTLELARLGGVNLHGSLLPQYRGAAPVAWAIYDGQRETGVSVIQMSADLDAGPCIGQGRTEIRADETAVELEERLAGLGAPLVRTAVDQLAAGAAQPIVQDSRLTTRAPRLKKSDGLVDWGRTAEQIDNQVRAMQPWPMAHTFWHRSGTAPLRIILHEVAVTEEETSAQAGVVVAAADDRLRIATGGGGLDLCRLQPAGKRILTAEQFLRGYQLQVGDRLQADG